MHLMGCFCDKQARGKGGRGYVISSNTRTRTRTHALTLTRTHARALAPVLGSPQPFPYIRKGDYCKDRSRGGIPGGGQFRKS